MNEAENFAPRISPVSRNIFFTRYLSATNTYGLMVYSRAQSAEGQVGTLIGKVVVANVDVRPMMKWSPDNQLLAYVGNDADGRAVVYLTDEAGQTAAGVVYREPVAGTTLTLEWMPNSRAIIIGSPTQGLVRQWVVGDSRTDKLGPGTDAAWQP